MNQPAIPGGIRTAELRYPEIVTPPTRTGRRILRHEVPVDDEWHTIRLSRYSYPLHVACRTPGAVELWAVDLPGDPLVDRVLRVFGTGQPLPDGVHLSHVGSALNGGLVWHLIDTSVGNPWLQPWGGMRIACGAGRG
jgi:hypothetical protein